MTKRTLRTTLAAMACAMTLTGCADRYGRIDPVRSGLAAAGVAGLGAAVVTGLGAGHGHRGYGYRRYGYGGFNPILDGHPRVGYGGYSPYGGFGGYRGSFPYGGYGHGGFGGHRSYGYGYGGW